MLKTEYANFVDRVNAFFQDLLIYSASCSLINYCILFFHLEILKVNVNTTVLLIFILMEISHLGATPGKLFHKIKVQTTYINENLVYQTIRKTLRVIIKSITLYLSAYFIFLICTSNFGIGYLFRFMDGYLLNTFHFTINSIFHQVIIFFILLLLIMFHSGPLILPHYFLITKTPLNQALHDILSGCIVVKNKNK
jgi:uncharacterized RDD family membrane protein YckC